MTEHYLGNSIEDSNYGILINEKPSRIPLTKDDFIATVENGTVVKMIDRNGVVVTDEVMNFYNELIIKTGYGQHNGKLYIQVV